MRFHAVAGKSLKTLGIPALVIALAAAIIPAYSQPIVGETKVPAGMFNSYAGHFTHSGELSDYNHFQLMTTDLGVTCYSILGGELLITPTPHGKSSDLFLLKNSVMRRQSKNYSVECDVKLDHDVDHLYAGGAFGIAFWGTQSGFSRQFFAFMWSGGYGNFGGWSVVVSDISPYNGFSLVPTYVPGHWVHLKALCFNGNYKCYADLHDGKGERLLCASAKPVGSRSNFGSAGMIGYCGNPGVKDPMPSNHVHFKNFKVQRLLQAPWTSKQSKKNKKS